MLGRVGFVLVLLIVSLVGCQGAGTPTPAGAPGTPRVLATENFLADIAQNVAGSRLQVGALLPIGVDPHSYEFSPRDVTRLAESQVLIVNGGGLETYLNRLLANAGGTRLVITASEGLTPRTPSGEEPKLEEETDPHFWLDPILVIRYVENIRDGLSQADAAGAPTYAANATAYSAQLRELDQYIEQQVQQIPPERRLLVTNHESLGYFADRYGFRIVGTIVPSVSSGASPSAQQLARLVDDIRASNAPAVFLEAGTNTQLAQQIARETGVKVVTGLYTHSVAGDAATYIGMMRHNIEVIVQALR